MHKNISGTMFYSFLFAIGGAPTIAMLLIQSQVQHPETMYGVLINLSAIIACILIPIILIQNSILWLKRKNVVLEQKIKPLCYFYLGLNVLCLIYWLIIQFQQ